MEITLKEVEVQKLNLQPGEVLVVKIKSDQIDTESINQLAQQFRKLIPNNKVAVLSVGEQDNIDLTVAKQSEYPEVNYCSDCSCGKKAAYERGE